MAKLRSVENLEDAIAEEIAWRKQELATTKRAVRRSSGAARAAHLRSGVLFLYAHWEGWIKAVAQLYVRHVNSQSLTYSDLSVAFLGQALKVQINKIADSSTASSHNDFARFLLLNMGQGARLSEDLVQTQSNLSSAVLSDIVTRLGLPKHRLYETRSNLVDQELVYRRNQIAHGRFLELDSDTFYKLQDDVIELLELFTDDVRNAASTKSYR